MKKVVSVKFKNQGNIYNSKEYYYFTTFPVAAGDEVIVDTPNQGLQVVMIYDNDVENTELQKRAVKYLVQKIDRREYDRLVANQVELLRLKKAMDDRVEMIRENSMYENLAKADDILAELLAEYKTKLETM